MPLSFSDRVAVVTGTSSGIGLALVRALVDSGWTVVGVARRSPKLTHPGYRHLSLNLADQNALRSRFEPEIAALLSDARCRRVGLVNNAASVGRMGSLDGMETAAALATYAINVIAPTWLMGFAIRHARRESALRIVNVSSGAAVRAIGGMGEYSSSKAALRMASMAAAADLESEPLASRAASDAAVLSYSPGIVDTPMQMAARAHSLVDFPAAAMFKQWHAEGALVKPEVPAAEIASFLESAQAPRFAERRLGDAVA